MGIVYQGECSQCGFQGEYCLGRGRTALWLEGNLGCLQEKERVKLKELMQNGQICSFTIENELVSCKDEPQKQWQEKTIITVATTEGEEMVFGGQCPQCSNSLVRYTEAAILAGESVACCKCGSNLHFTKIGHWD